MSVVCLGEALVDFLPSKRGVRLRDVPSWHPCVGGAPANVAVGIARLGGSSALVGVTGEDEFGYFLRGGLEAEGVDVSGLRHTSEGRTGLGFVSLTKSGERSFTFYRNRSAETFIGSSDAKTALSLVRSGSVLHVGTNSLVEKHARGAVLGAVSQARRAGHITSVDPNLRLRLWPKPAVLRALLDELLPQCAVVKLSDEEVRFVTDASSPEKALTKLEAKGIPLVVVTLGAQGAICAFRGERLRAQARKVKVIDTTGAGDGFMAGLLYTLARAATSREALEQLKLTQVQAAIERGCVVGTQAVMRLGALGRVRS